MVLAKSLSEACVGLARYVGTSASVLPRLVSGSSSAGVPCQDLAASSAFCDLHSIMPIVSSFHLAVNMGDQADYTDDQSISMFSGLM